MSRSLSSFAAVFVAVCAALAPTKASASNYPPDYPICHAETVQDAGPFSIVKNVYNPYKHNVKLVVSYHGKLLERYRPDQIELYVRLNGNDALIPASAGSYGDAYVALAGGPRTCRMCYDSPQYTANDAKCRDSIAHGITGWICEDPTPLEDRLFYWAVNNNGLLNNWDMQVAATAGGEWDSNFGTNYSTTFADTGCGG